MLAIICLALVLTGCDDLRMYTEYEDIDAVRADGAFERGWFPTWMPEHAIEIHEYHDLDTSIQSISFRVENGSEFKWPEHCSISINASKPGLKTKKFPKAVHKLEGVRNCRNYYVVSDNKGMVHMWNIR